MKNLYSVKDTIKRIKKAIDREKNICKVISNQGLNSIWTVHILPWAVYFTVKKKKLQKKF